MQMFASRLCRLALSQRGIRTRKLCLLSEPNFNVNALSWAKIATGLFQQNLPIADFQHGGC